MSFSWPRFALAGAALFVGGAGPAMPAAKPAPPPAVHLRVGTHDGFTRLVYELPDGIGFSAQHVGNLLVLSFPNAGMVPSLKPAPAPLLSVSGGVDAAAAGLPTGSKTHLWQIGRKVILDVFPPAPTTAPTTAPTAAPAAAAPVAPQPPAPAAVLPPVPPLAPPPKPDLKPIPAAH